MAYAKTGCKIMEIAAVHIELASSRSPVAFVAVQCRLYKTYLKWFDFVTKWKDFLSLSGSFVFRRRVYVKRGSEISGQMPRLYFQMLFMVCSLRCFQHCSWQYILQLTDVARPAVAVMRSTAMAVRVCSLSMVTNITTLLCKSQHCCVVKTETPFATLWNDMNK